MRTTIVLTSLHNREVLEEIQQKGGIVYTAMISPFKDRPEPNVKLLAATEALVFGHKHGTGDTRFKRFAIITDEQYREEYLKLLIGRRDSIDKWLEEQEYDDIAICCSCPGGLWGAKRTGKWKFCHLDVLEEWFFLTYGKNYTVKRL